VKKKKRNFIKVFFAVIMIPFMFAGFCGDVKLFASDYYEESLYFDENGNFFMTTHDAVATKTTRYCTLGWTIKKYDLPIDDPLNMCATIIITCDGSVVDPENERYLYSFFYCDKDRIFEAIGDVSKEWQRELYLNGATVYLDGIMTVIEKDVVQGSLSRDGSRSGEVYDSYEGIASARNWGVNSKDSLKTHFNKSVFFPSITGFFEKEEAEESMEDGVIRFDNGESGFDVGVTISANGYNPKRAIPSGKTVKIKAWQQAYTYEVKYTKIAGKITQRIPVSIVADKTVTDGTGAVTKTREVISKTTYELQVPYMYYVIDEVTVYYADGVYVSSDAFSGRCYVDTEYKPEVEIVMREGINEHVTYEEISEAVEVYIGDITDAEEIQEEIRANIENIIDVPMVRNDYLSIDGEELMSDDWTYEAEAPSQNSFRIETVSANKNVTVPVSTLNGKYSLKATAYYDYICYGNSEADYISVGIGGLDKINVHTPVVCYGSVSNLKEWNQAEMPSKNRPTIVLGRDFVVSLSNKGNHIEEKGYGKNDYEEFAEDNQVKFPFSVFDEKGELHKANTWISMGNTKYFVLPMTVIEGSYEVEFRTIAYNYSTEEMGEKCSENNANLSAENYMATDTVMIEVVGQLYGFKLTEFVDYKNIEIPEGGIDVSGLPFVYGDTGMAMGSYFRFGLKSVGSYEKGAKVTIVPSFWYIREDKLEKVDIYYEDVRNDGMAILKRWSTDVHKLELTESHAVTEDGNVNERQRIWEGIYMLPMKIFCLPAGETLPSHGIDEECFLEPGRILIKFCIRIEDRYGKNVLLYINEINAKEGYCNRWEKEGGKDGEVIVYDMEIMVKDRMKITGTH